jgi:competence protein ComFC
VTKSLRAGAAGLARSIELLLFPSFCRLCAKPLEHPGERIVCRACLERLRPRRGPICPRCGRFLEGEGEPHLCARCLEQPPPFTVHRSCGRYDGVLKDLILLFKYRRVSVLSGVLGRFVQDSLGADETLWVGADYLVPVPLHRKREHRRGFNQSRLLAREVGRRSGTKVLDGCLVKVRNSPPQTSLAGRGREVNVRGAYEVRKVRKVEGKTLILVDDVFTTGSTLGECSLTLRRAGAGEVRALTLAQA